MMLRGALVGCGKIAQTGHIPAYVMPEVAERAVLVAAVEPASVNREATRRLLPDVRFYDSLDELLTSETLDFVDLCTPPRQHALQAARAAERGLAVLCEKPFCPERAEAERLHRRLSAAGVVFVPCHQYRYSALWRLFKAEIASSPGGSALALFTVLRTQADQGFDPGHPGWRTDASAAGGGILADTGVHYLYLCPWMLGAPLGVHARTATIRHRDLTVEDTAVVTLECERGTAVVSLTWAAAVRYNSATLTTASGTLLYDGTSLVRHRGGSAENLSVPDAADKTHYIGCYAALINDFLDLVARHAPDPAWLDEALASVCVLDACYRSARSGASVRLP